MYNHWTENANVTFLLIILEAFPITYIANKQNVITVSSARIEQMQIFVMLNVDLPKPKDAFFLNEL